MSMIEWAEREVQLALDKEITSIMNNPEDTAEMKDMGKQYTEGCYQSALKTYKTLLEDDHSGYSFGVTCRILKRLLDGYPLTPIEDIPESWNNCKESDKVIVYQSKRCYSLFKEVDKKTGKVSFRDAESVICIGPDGASYINGFITKKIRELYPIKMPYWPEGKYYVQVADFAVSSELGVFDTLEVKSVKKPDGTVIILNWYYKESPEGWKPIDEKEFQERYSAYKANQAKLIEKRKAELQADDQT